ncbi:hypothetical protein OAH77_04525 [Flavobacteriaceae bacterium]|nr:hypothetical protein [Flavobacteriaceae bacterium]
MITKVEIQRNCRELELFIDDKLVATISNCRSVSMHGEISDELREKILHFARTDTSKLENGTEFYLLSPSEKIQYHDMFQIGNQYKAKLLQYVRNGKQFLVGSIYTVDEELYKLSCKGFESYSDAKEAAERFGYTLWGH